MKAFLTAALFLALLWAVPVRTQAQIDRGDLRLFFDTGLLTFTAQRAKGDTPIGHRKITESQLSLGSGRYVGPTTGIGAGFAVSRKVIPSFYFGFQRVKVRQEQEIDNVSTELELTFSQYELRPFLELAVVSSPFVPYVVLGLSFLRRRQEREGRADSTSSGFGPVVGAGIHAFASRRASIDFGALFRVLFVDDEAREESLKRQGLDDIRQHDFAFLLTLGASVWL